MAEPEGARTRALDRAAGGVAALQDGKVALEGNAGRPAELDTGALEVLGPRDGDRLPVQRRALSALGDIELVQRRCGHDPDRWDAVQQESDRDAPVAVAA